MPAGVHVTGPVSQRPVTGGTTGRDEQTQRTWWYAVIALTAAVVALVVMAAFQYATTETTVPTETTVAVSAVPAKYAGVSIPQAMRLSDTVVSAVPAKYAGVSIPQAMRLSDLNG
jgi:anti-sigma-K factor RskA